MNKISNLVISSVLLFGSASPLLLEVGNASALTGNGTSGDPYVISSCGDLEGVIGGNSDVHYELGQDIDCTGVNGGNGFTPIGTVGLSNGFRGVFDGRNYTISGVAINAAQQDGIGLFAGTEGATIKNLKLDGVTITDAGYDTGTLVGMAYNTNISHVSSTNLSITEGIPGWNVGGLTGQFDSGDLGTTISTLDSAAASGTITSSQIGGMAYGGLVGELNYNIITNSYANVSINVLHAERVGGLVGYSAQAKVKNSYALGDMVADLAAGGLAGLDGGNSKFYNDFALGRPGSTRGDWGGLVAELGGSPQATFINSYFDKTSTGANDCTWSGPVAGCTGINADGTDGNYFKNTTTVAPLTSWDFQSAWQSTADYPVLRDINLISPPTLTVPGAVRNLSVTAQHNALTVGWTIPADDGNTPITDYQVRYRVHGSGSWTATSIGASTVFTTLITTDNTTYDVAVAAVNSQGAGAYTEVDGTISGTIPGPVQGLTAVSDYTNTSITAEWSAPASGSTPTGYAVYIRDEDGANTWSTPDMLGNAATTDTFSGLTIGHSYDFKVIANSALGDGDPAEIDDVALLPPVYDITTCEELQNMQNDLTGHYRLMNDIDCSATSGWNGGGGFRPIGNFSLEQAFSGSLDGQGHHISGLFINATSDNVGMFSILGNGADVHNLHLDSAEVGGAANVGALAGLALGGVTISDVTVYAYVSSQDQTGGVLGFGGVGSLVGLAGQAVSISKVATSGVVVAAPSGSIGDCVGGIIGIMLNGTDVSNSYSVSEVYAPDTGELLLGGAVGGMLEYLGVSDLPTLHNVYAAGGMNGADGVVEGGLVGAIQGGEVFNSFSATQFANGGTPSTIGGSVGYDTDMTLQGVYFDAGAANTEACDGSGSVTGCAAIDTGAAPDVTYFFGNTVNPPLDQWDFSTVWRTEDGDYPTLRPAATTPPDNSGSGNTGGTTSGMNGISNEAGTQKFVQQLASGSLATGTDDVQPTENVSYSLDDLPDYLQGNGEVLTLSVGQVVHFTLTRHGKLEQHTATVKEIGGNYVVLTIASKPFDVRLQIGENKQISISGVPALNVTLQGLWNGQATIQFSRVVAVQATQHAKAGASHSRHHAWYQVVIGFAVFLVLAGLALGVRRSVNKR